MQAKQFLSEGASCATVAVMADKENLSQTIPAFRVTDSAYQMMLAVVKRERRTITDIARFFFERGRQAYERDGQLFEPEDANDEPTITVPSSTLPGPVKKSNIRGKR